MRICELKQKEVINICTCRTLGCPVDVDLTVKPDVLPPLWFPDLAVSAFVSGEPEVNI